MVGEAIHGYKFIPGGIGSIFKSFRLRVPPYQREYAWEIEQVQQLYEDLSRAKSELSDYFLGTIVTIRVKDGAYLEIVDGQQRLTTTALLIAAIRDLQKELGQTETVIESINNDYLSSFDRLTNSRVAKLTLNIDDNAFFEGLLSNTPIPTTRESHDRLQAAYKEAIKHSKKLISTFSKADQASVLNEWLEFLEKGASVILVETEDGSKAFKMFETLNDRGLKTSQADLVKSYLFGESGKRLSESQSRWSSMKDNLEEINDDDRAINFLRHSLIAAKKFVRAEEVYEYVQTQIRGESNSVAFVSSLEKNSRAYVATFQPNSSHWKGYSMSATRALATFNMFNLKPIRPLLLALALEFRPKNFEKAIKLLLSISVRLVIAGKTRSGVIEQTVASAALSVSKKTITTPTQLKSSLKGIIVTDQEFEEEFAKARVSKSELARYYLRALESANDNETEPWFVQNDDASEITLEHILPSNPKGSDWNEFDEEEQRLYTRRIGNLCLLQKSGNGNAGNLAFSDKRSTYNNSPLALTAQIGRNKKWTPNDIVNRQLELSKLATKAWPI